MKIRSKDTSEPADSGPAPQSDGNRTMWATDEQFGPDARWLTQWLCQFTFSASHMNPMDMGCGSALGAMFLAHAFEKWRGRGRVKGGDRS